jgi:alpha-tubulin suppressor-like RCC1 family protein
MCALLSGGTVKCWGSNYAGELGDGTIGDGSGGPSTPVQVIGLSDVTAIASGDSWHTCALRRDGTVKCWGENSAGELGDGTKVNRSTPVSVVGLADVDVVAAGQEDSCAGLVDLSVWCWGSNSKGQLGDGTTTDSLTPVVVAGL